MRHCARIGLATCLALSSTVIANAADITPLLAPTAEPQQTQSGWQFSVAPYFWMAGLTGDTSQLGLPNVHIDSSFGDIWNNLDFALMVTGEARNGPYSIFGDTIYIKLSASGSTPDGVLADSVSLDTQSFSATLGAGYAIYEDQNSHLDVVGGLKVWSVDTTLSFSGGSLGGVSRDDSATWVDAVAGLRGAYYFTPEFYLTGWGLIGGGGADLDWDAALGLGYKFTDTISAVAGYRALGVDYSNDGFKYDVVQHGPIIGVSVRF
ncbi:hypothetical protein [Ensifer sp.]|uniref:hypothetical protein n=1 Tax=Ensifer sp. TaxID=1872086 RepID=UPI000DDA2FCA|nr:hypothetical protein [Ensifer sp.]